MTAPDTLPPELAELGELLREDPPRPDPAWARKLDQRAAAGFPRPPRRPWWARLVPPRGALLPALGLVAAAAIVAVVVTLPPKAENASSGGGGSTGSTAAQTESSSSDSAASSGGSSGASTSRPSIAPPGPGGGSPGSDSRTKRLQERSA